MSVVTFAESADLDAITGEEIREVRGSIAPINRNVCLAAIAQREFNFPKSY